jgi:hypothetical protein
LPETNSALGADDPTINLDLTVNPPVETITAMGQKAKVDYSLTYPLALRQIEEGKRPLMDFDQYAVLVITKKNAGTDQEIYGTFKTVDRKGQQKTVSYTQIKGYPIVRYLAVDPYSNSKITYKYTIGMQTYELIYTNF